MHIYLCNRMHLLCDGMGGRLLFLLCMHECLQESMMAMLADAHAADDSCNLLLPAHLHWLSDSHCPQESRASNSSRVAQEV